MGGDVCDVGDELWQPDATIRIREMTAMCLILMVAPLAVRDFPEWEGVAATTRSAIDDDPAVPGSRASLDLQLVIGR